MHSLTPLWFLNFSASNWHRNSVFTHVRYLCRQTLKIIFNLTLLHANKSYTFAYKLWEGSSTPTPLFIISSVGTLLIVRAFIRQQRKRVQLSLAFIYLISWACDKKFHKGGKNERSCSHRKLLVICALSKIISCISVCAMVSILEWKYVHEYTVTCDFLVHHLVSTHYQVI